MGMAHKRQWKITVPGQKSILFWAEEYVLFDISSVFIPKKMITRNLRNRHLENFVDQCDPIDSKIFRQFCDKMYDKNSISIHEQTNVIATNLNSGKFPFASVQPLITAK